MRKRSCMYFSLIFLFILGCRDGMIALWKDGNPEPVRIFPYSAAVLPEADRQALEHGIPIGDDGMLAQLLEDYLS